MGKMAYETDSALRTIFKRCVECPNTTPVCPKCADSEICSLVPSSCTTCAYMTCIPAPPRPTAPGPNVGAIAGGVVGGVAFVALVVFLIWRFWIKKRREEQDRELEEEWQQDDIASQKQSQQFQAMATDAASTRTRGSLANSILSRASNIIQIAYIPGVTNRNGSGHNSLLNTPVPPIPAGFRSSQPPKSALSNADDALFFRPGDLRDSTWSGHSSLGVPGNRDTQFTMRSITSSLARSSMVSDVHFNDATATRMPANAAQRGAPRMVSIKSGTPDSASLKSDEGAGATGDSAAEADTTKPKGLQVVMPGQGLRPSMKNTTGSLVKATKVFVGGKGKARSPLGPGGDSSKAGSSQERTQTTSPIAEGDEESETSVERPEQNVTKDEKKTEEGGSTPSVQPAESPFFDPTDAPSASTSASLNARPNPYASMASTVSSSGENTPRRANQSIGGLSAVIEEATRRASRVPSSHEPLASKRDHSPFSDENGVD